METSSAHIIQKEVRKKLIGLLYKEGYCICIPDFEHVQLLLNKANEIDIQRLLLEKNPIGFSVIPMFMLIAVKYKHLSPEECECLLSLVILLLNHLETSFITAVLEEKCNNKSIIYYLSHALESEQGVSRKNLDRVQVLTDCLNLLIEKNVKANDIALDREISKPTYSNRLKIPHFFAIQTSQICDYFSLFRKRFYLKNSKELPLELNERSPLMKHAF